MQETPYTSVRKADIVRGGAWALVARVLSAVFGVVAAVFITRLVAPADVGVYFVMLAIVGIAVMIGGLGSGKAVTSLAGRASSLDPGSVPTTIVRGIALASIGGLAVGTALLITGLLGWQPESLSATSPAIWSVAAGMVVIGTTRSVAAEGLRALGDIRGASLWLELIPNALFVLILGTISIVVLDVEPMQLLMGMAVAWLLTLAGSLISLWKRVSVFPRSGAPPSTGAFLVIGLPWVGIAVLSVAALQVGTIVLGAIGSGEDAAIYGTALRLAAWIGVPLAIVNAVLPPFIVRLWTAGDRNRLNALLSASATLTTIPAAAGVLIFLVAGPWILGVLFGAFYEVGYRPLMLLSVGQLLSVFSGSCVLVLVLTGHQRIVLTIALATVPVTIMAMIPMGMLFGATGVAVVAAASIGVRNALTVIAANRRAGIRTWASLSPKNARSVARMLADGARGDG